jgi:hypothetical protein
VSEQGYILDRVESAERGTVWSQGWPLYGSHRRPARLLGNANHVSLFRPGYSQLMLSDRDIGLAAKAMNQR